jgi:hypothetical protein
MSERARQVWMGLGVTLLSGVGCRDMAPVESVTPPPGLVAIAAERNRSTRFRPW